LYYRLQNYCRLVKGASRGAIYNFQTGKVLSINQSSLKLLHACSENTLNELFNITALENNPPLEFLHKLTQMGLGSFYLKEPEHPQQVSWEEPAKLDFLWLELTSSCNNTCLHCYATSGPCINHDCVPHERWLSLISEARKEGATAIQLIGGEPLLYPNWRDLVIKASEEEYEFIEIFSNATLIDDACIEFFRQYKVNIATTIYAGNAETHDKVTLNPGSFEKTVTNVKKLKAANVPLRIASIIMKANEDEVANIIKLCTELGIEAPAPDVVRPTGRGNDSNLLPEVYHKPKIRPPFYTDERSFARAQCCHNCLMGKIAVTSNGDVIPCIFARNQISGNILTTPLAEILNAQPLQQCWYTTKDYVDKCNECEYRYACYDCRPLAQGSDPQKRWLACSTGCAYNPYTGEWEGEPCPQEGNPNDV
jgi:radical SAM protein with 4Fe4S-binding SPASM domain